MLLQESNLTTRQQCRAPPTSNLAKAEWRTSQFDWIIRGSNTALQDVTTTLRPPRILY